MYECKECDESCLSWYVVARECMLYGVSHYTRANYQVKGCFYSKNAQ